MNEQAKVEEHYKLDSKTGLLTGPGINYDYLANKGTAEDMNLAFAQGLAAREAQLKVAVDALKNLTYTAQHIWDKLPKPIMSGGAVIITNPIIEEAKAALSRLGVK